MGDSLGGPAGTSGNDTLRALRAAVEVARLAPSVHNTQPWRWSLTSPTTVELRAQRSRQLAIADPDGLLLTESCGAALHHLRLALEAEGLRADVARVPEAHDPDLLARVSVVGRIATAPHTSELVAATRTRRTDRRPVSDRPVPMAVLETVTAAMCEQGASVYLLQPDQVIELSVAMADADWTEVSEQEHRAEIATWVGGNRPDGTGIPTSSVPNQPPRTQVPSRYFGPPGTLDTGGGHDATARYAIAHADSDTCRDWLVAGEALSAGWLAATVEGLSLLPISAVVEVTSSRMAVRRLLSGIGYPYFVVRLGYVDQSAPSAPQTPRLPIGAILDEVTSEADL
jgi:nitroreductase